MMTPADITVKHLLGQVKHRLDQARARGDRLAVDLAEAALNDLLDRSDVTDVTCNEKGIHERGKARR